MSEYRPRYQTVPLTQPLRWDAWMKHLWENSPSRIFDAEERQVWVDAYWAANPRLEAKQWRRAGIHAPEIKAPAVVVGEERSVMQVEIHEKGVTASA